MNTLFFFYLGDVNKQNITTQERGNLKLNATMSNHVSGYVASFCFPSFSKNIVIEYV